MRRSSSRFRYSRIIGTRSRGWSSHRLSRRWKISLCFKGLSSNGCAWFKYRRLWDRLQTDIGSFKSYSLNRLSYMSWPKGFKRLSEVILRK
jgi:hypothetical protein